MRKAIFIVIMSIVTEAGAMTFLGPATSDIKHGDVGFGIEYAMGETDLEWGGYGLTGSRTNTESDLYLARIILGLGEGLDFSARLGMDNIEESGNEFAWGLGARAKLAETGDLNWGLLFQMTSIAADDEYFDGAFFWQQELDLYEYKIAVGPVYEKDSLTIYGGPFVHFIDGDYEETSGSTRRRYNVEQESDFGGYIGAGWQIAQNSNLMVEYQTTGDADVFAVSWVNLFGKKAPPMTPKVEAPEYDSAGRRLKGYQGRINPRTGAMETYPVYEDEK